eukprot:8823716-Heterocapsa_arctica.AAC.1
MKAIASEEFQDIFEAKLLVVEKDIEKPITQASIEEGIREFLEGISSKPDVHKYLHIDREVVIKYPAVKQTINQYGVSTN